MKPKKYTEDVRVLNDGLHSTRALNTVQQLFTTNDLKGAVLYQFIVSGSQSKPVYQATMKALMRHIRTKCRAEYVGAYEVGEEKNGLHLHAFVIIETAKHFPSDLLDVSKGEWISRRIKRTGLSIRIEPPKNRMHGGAMFAKMNTPAKLENCINWCTYILKRRSKDDVPGRETYFGSEFVSNIAKREAKRQKYRDALTKSSRPAQQNISLPPAAPSAAENVATQETQRKEIQNETVLETQTSASSKASACSTSQGPATPSSQACDEATASSSIPASPPIRLPLVDAKAKWSNRTVGTRTYQREIEAESLIVSFKQVLRHVGGDSEENGGIGSHAPKEALKTRLNQSCGFERANLRNSFLRRFDIR